MIGGMEAWSATAKEAWPSCRGVPTSWTLETLDQLSMWDFWRVLGVESATVLAANELSRLTSWMVVGRAQQYIVVGDEVLHYRRTLIMKFL